MMGLISEINQTKNEGNLKIKKKKNPVMGILGLNFGNLKTRKFT